MELWRLPTVYVSKETKEKLYRFINRSRLSPEFGAEKKLKNPNQAILMLLDFALRYEFEDFELLTKIPLLMGEMKEEVFENEDARNKIILKQFEGLQENEKSEGD